MLNNVAFLPSFQFRAYLTTISLWIILSLNAVAVYIFNNWHGFQQVSSLFQNFTG